MKITYNKKFRPNGADFSKIISQSRNAESLAKKIRLKEADSISFEGDPRLCGDDIGFINPMLLQLYGHP